MQQSNIMIFDSHHFLYVQKNDWNIFGGNQTCGYRGWWVWISRGFKIIPLLDVLDYQGVDAGLKVRFVSKESSSSNVNVWMETEMDGGTSSYGHICVSILKFFYNIINFRNFLTLMLLMQGSVSMKIQLSRDFSVWIIWNTWRKIGSLGTTWNGRILI